MLPDRLSKKPFCLEKKKNSTAFATPLTCYKGSPALSQVTFSTFCPRYEKKYASWARTSTSFHVNHLSGDSAPVRYLVKSSLPVRTRASVRFESLLKNKAIIQVDSGSGRQTLQQRTDKVDVITAILPLPNGEVPEFSISSSRYAEAYVYARKDVLENLDDCPAPFILFAHGFSQVPTNYNSILQYLAVQGYVVLAPSTWLLAVIFKKVETVTWKNGLPARLQTALLIDIARTFNIASNYSSTTHLLGHSMGGAMALVYSGYANDKIESIGLLAPEVGGVALTPLNQTVRLDANDGRQRLESLLSHLTAKICILHGNKDKIVPKKDMKEVFEALKKGPLLCLISLPRGTHIGFEDGIDVNVPFLETPKIFFKLVDLLVYGPVDIFGLRTKDQLITTKLLLATWYSLITRNEKIVKSAMRSATVPSELTQQWSSDS